MNDKKQKEWKERIIILPLFRQILTVLIFKHVPYVVQTQSTCARKYKHFGWASIFCPMMWIQQLREGKCCCLCDCQNDISMPTKLVTLNMHQMLVQSITYFNTYLLIEENRMRQWLCYWPAVFLSSFSNKIKLKL